MDGFFNSDLDGPPTVGASQLSSATQGGDAQGSDAAGYGARALSKSRCVLLRFPAVGTWNKAVYGYSSEEGKIYAMFLL